MLSKSHRVPRVVDAEVGAADGTVCRLAAGESETERRRDSSKVSTKADHAQIGDCGSGVGRQIGVTRGPCGLLSAKTGGASPTSTNGSERDLIVR
jgi:hypothetical protein